MDLRKTRFQDTQKPWIVSEICMESQENPGYHHTNDFPYHLGRHWAVFSCLDHDPLDGIHGFSISNHGKQ